MEPWEIKFEDYYAELRCSPDDPPEVIMAVYKALAKRYHPDGGLNPDASRMSRMNVAKDVLTNPTMREAYDRAYRAARGRTSGPADGSQETQEGPGPADPMAMGSDPPSDPPPDPDDPSEVDPSPKSVPSSAPPSDARRYDNPMASPGSTGPSKRFPITVDYTRSIVDMTMDAAFDKNYFLEDPIALGNYSHPHSDSMEVVIELYEPLPGHRYTTILGTLDDLGYRPATLPELLVFAKLYPAEQFKYDIYGMGTRLRSDSNNSISSAEISASEFAGRFGQFFSLDGKKSYNNRCRLAVVRVR